MNIELTLGEEQINLTIPEKNLLSVLEPANNLPSLDIDAQKRDLKEQVSNFLTNANSILFIINDYTRPTPTPEILKILEAEASKLKVGFLVACGSHRAPDEKEFYQIFGEFYDRYKDRVFVHNAKDNGSLRFLGTTGRGTPVFLNKILWNYDKLITINSVEPHYFAGFTGGRKSFIPGVAGYETITLNHKLSLNPQAKTLALAGNPVHEDMTEITKMIDKEIFSIQIVVLPNQDMRATSRIYSLRFGNIFDSFIEAVEDAKRVFCIPIKTQADIVITTILPPYDVDFYQSQKGIENAKLALKKKGLLIVASRCRKGVGDEAFVKILASSQSPIEAIERIKKDFKLGYHKAAKLAEIMIDKEICTVMSIPDEIVKSVFMKPFNSLQSALDSGLERKGKDASVIIIKNGSLTVPLLPSLEDA